MLVIMTSEKILSKSREEILQESLELKYLANEHRLSIIMFLKKRKSATVGEIADILHLSFKGTSKHLLFLVKRGILVRHDDNPFVIYSLSSSPNLSSLTKQIISLL
jgi:Fic family protein